MRAAEQRVLDFLRDPDGSNEEIDHSLEERGLVAFNTMPRKQQNPPAYKQRQADPPERQNQQNDSRDDDRDSDAVQNLVPHVVMFVVVLRHVLAERGHRAPPVVSGPYIRPPPGRSNKGKEQGGRYT